jgi:hypothetical protein
MKRENTIEADVTFAIGGRAQLPIGTGYAPHLVVTGDNQWLGVRFLDFPTCGIFGEPCQVRIELLYPDRVDYGKLQKDMTFAVHEGPKIVATGRVTNRG